MKRHKSLLQELPPHSRLSLYPNSLLSAMADPYTPKKPVSQISGFFGRCVSCVLYDYFTRFLFYYDITSEASIPISSMLLCSACA